MTKHNHQLKVKQVYNIPRGVQPERFEKMLLDASQPMQSADVRFNLPVNDNSIQLRAYQLYREKGGPALDNWLEAEQILKNEGSAVPRFIDEGNPNTQK